MNALRTAALAAATLSLATCAHSQGLLDGSLDLLFDDGQGNTMPYRLFLPAGHGAPGASYPLVLALHGGSGEGTDNIINVRPYFEDLINNLRSTRFASILVVPQSPGGDQGGFQEGKWHDCSVVALTCDVGLTESTELALKIVEQVELEYQVDSSRRAVTGVSSGGAGFIRIVLRASRLLLCGCPGQ